ncbi:MAG: pyridoxal-phosphate dependent enzyme [Woeseiaceae bacterium]|nr:pyridoxal-phosphate dependent enzyme [Woeseiaceae bacterium]
MRVYSNILDMVGRTPMLEITRLDTGPCRLFLKLEMMNPGGSIKDRIGMAMIEEAERRGELTPGDTILEATSGNTGIALALVAAQKGYRLVLVIPDKMSPEKINNLRAMGAEIVLTRSDVNRGHPEYYIDLGERLAKEQGAYLVDQFSNPDNPLAHEQTTMPEILEQLGGEVDAIVMGAGSSGTIAGICNYLEKHPHEVEVVLADPVGSILAAYAETGERGEKTAGWLVEGIGKDFIPSITNFSKVTKAYTIGDAEAFNTGRELLRAEGLLAGSSSGALLAAALRYCREQTEPKRVVTFACDTGNKYLSKHLNDSWMEDHGFIARERFGDLRDLIGRPYGANGTVTVGPDDILTTAYNRLRIADYSHLPVMDGDRLVGVVSGDAILEHMYDDPGRAQAPVRDAMEREFETLDSKEPVPELLARLKTRKYVAIAAGDAFLGLVTRADALSYLRRQS